MKTEELIQELASAPQPGSPVSKAAALLAAAFCGVVITVVGVVGFMGLRHDWSHALTPMVLKIGYGLLAACLLIPLALHAAGPNVRLKNSAVAIFLLPVIAISITWIGLTTAPNQSRWTLWLNGGATGCIACIAALAVPIGAILMLTARRFAPTRLTLAGAALGALAGALAVIPYSLNCQIDSAPYVATWYGLAILFCALIGAVLGSRFLRW